jgi:hypothetical protein
MPARIGVPSVHSCDDDLVRIDFSLSKVGPIQILSCSCSSSKRPGFLSPIAARNSSYTHGVEWAIEGFRLSVLVDLCGGGVDCICNRLVCGIHGARGGFLFADSGNLSGGPDRDGGCYWHHFENQVSCMMQD